MANSLRIINNNLYSIEVNDDGDCIYFDISDMLTLIHKINELYKRLTKAQRKLTETLKENEEIDAECEIDNLIDNRTLANIEAYNAYYAEGRVAFDFLLGDGSCMKIFGEYNRITMFEELIDALNPHFEKMGVQFSDYSDYIAKKYGKKPDADVLEA